MFLYLFFLCCVLHPILHYYCVFGKRASLRRFVVEDGAKPAIFGSYSYDPVKQMFIPPPPEQIKNNSIGASNELQHHTKSTVPEVREEPITSSASGTEVANKSVTVLRSHEKTSNIKKIRPKEDKRSKNSSTLRYVKF